MNTKRLMMIVLIVASAVGCASVPMNEERPAAESLHDTEYVGAVNALARRSGTLVVWVNPPRARESSDDRE